MPTYLGTLNSPQALIDAGRRVSERFDATAHAVIGADLKKYLTWHSRYASRAEAVARLEASLEVAREALAQADAVRDEATLALDRALIADGAPKKNSFKAFGAPAPAALIDASLEDQGRAVRALIGKLKRAKDSSGAVKSALKALEKADAAVTPKASKVKGAVEALAAARKERDALERPLRRAFSVLKLRAKAAELDGAPGLYADLFADESRRSSPADEPRIPDSAPTPPNLP